jgi:hypothetical protein
MTDANPDPGFKGHDPIEEVLALLKIMQHCVELLGKRIDVVTERVNLLEPK